ncbi:protein kinase [Leishmania donovani]|uniref:Protein_kinase_domain/Protein_tyrosine_kinase_put ative/Pfam:PF00069/Pfam:PF07714 n=1 Tax=Leishmania donovani TaxID=5661 RepID=A0A6J8FMN2_LEIDO|nr:protein kinase [Leishmania donovani]VDZ47508.1 Protein_kinase_domain/Protein_tyrosine_kinase_putative/Pfam:PF00069/Pfam:PF07714 [Leishmania donovani]
MSSGDFMLELRYADCEDHLKMNGYCVHPPVSQECINNKDRSRSCSTDCSDSGVVEARGTIGSDGAAQQCCSHPTALLPPFHKPLVEDDVEDDDRSSDGSDDMVAKAALEHFLMGSASGLMDYSALETDGAANNCSLKSSPPSSTTTTDSSEGSFPCVDEEVLGDLGDVIGYGGDRGSFVCCVPLPPLSRMWKQAPSFAREPTFLEGVRCSEVKKAYKKYPTHISKDELSFVSTAYRCARHRERCQSSSSPFLTPEEAHYAALHLVLPDAVVLARGEKVGLLMPLYNCSLKEYLQSLANPASSPAAASNMPASLTVSHNANLHAEDADSSTALCNPQSSTFRSTATYRPIESIPVISAIVFQMLEAVAFLNHRLPHGDGSTGYTHNDLHLDNILLSYDGDVALCDFELVASTPTPSRSMDVRRLPPSSRQSPHGLFSETADTWAFGLMVVSLLTGVDPLFTSDIVNDFSDGPLLFRWDRSTRVLDWEANIKAHVELLLRRQDSTGKRLEEARHLLQLCGKCLVNREGAEPLRAVSLLEEAMFLPYRRDFSLATRTVKEWISRTRRV